MLRWPWWRLTSDFPLVSGIPAEDFLCVPEPDEDECLSSGLDGDETSHKQVSVEGPCTNIHQAKESVCMCKRERKTESKAKAIGTERRG